MEGSWVETCKFNVQNHIVFCNIAIIQEKANCRFAEKAVCFQLCDSLS